MKLTRREILRVVGATAASAFAARVLPACSTTSSAGPRGPFEHGVASGDPLADGVILWTRISPSLEMALESLQVDWEIARDAAFDEIITSGSTSTDASRDFTVKIDVRALSPSTTYYYRFRFEDIDSPIGRTRTAPNADVDRLRFAVVSCASLCQGYFHAYRMIAARADLDAVIHVGDYIYEFASGDYGQVRSYEPAHEAVSLDDYRTRYAQYRRDPDLQEVHRQHPFITTWDDHESANDSWRDGALNHMDGEGAWEERKASASRAYREWMPFREREASPAPLALWRVIRYGELVDLFVLDTRIWGREAPLENGDPLLMSETRQLLGSDQEAWLFEELTRSTAHWKILAQQVVFVQFPEIWNQFGWDGYPSARARLLNHVRANDVEGLVVLTGDFHSSWASDITEDPWDASQYDPSSGVGALGAEFVTPGITSPLFQAIDARNLEEDVRMNDPHIKWTNFSERGYIILDVNEARVQAAWFHFDRVDLASATERFARAFATRAGAPSLVEESAAAEERAAAPMLAPHITR